MPRGLVSRTCPPTPEPPPYLRGRSFVAVRGAYSGETPEAGKELMRPWYEGFGEPDVDDMRVMPYAKMDAISMDPVDPIAVETHVERLGELTPEARAKLVEVAGADSGMPSEVLEIRQLGGALGRAPVQPSAIGHRDSRFIMMGIG